jgi:hypothetical protein
MPPIVTVAVVWVVTALVVMATWADDLPDGKVKEAGRVTAALLELQAMGKLAGASPLS